MERSEGLEISGNVPDLPGRQQCLIETKVLNPLESVSAMCEKSLVVKDSLEPIAAFPLLAVTIRGRHAGRHKFRYFNRRLYR